MSASGSATWRPRPKGFNNVSGYGKAVLLTTAQAAVDFICRGAVPRDWFPKNLGSEEPRRGTTLGGGGLSMRPAGRQHSVTIPITPVRTSSDSLRIAATDIASTRCLARDRCRRRNGSHPFSGRIRIDAFRGSRPSDRTPSAPRGRHSPADRVAPRRPSPRSGDSRPRRHDRARRHAARRSTPSSSPNTRPSACSKTNISKMRSSSRCRRTSGFPA